MSKTVSTLSQVPIALVLCAVFVPMAFLSGVTGQFYRQFAINTCSLSRYHDTCTFCSRTALTTSAAVRPRTASWLGSSSFGSPMIQFIVRLLSNNESDANQQSLILFVEYHRIMEAHDGS